MHRTRVATALALLGVALGQAAPLGAQPHRTDPKASRLQQQIEETRTLLEQDPEYADRILDFAHDGEEGVQLENGLQATAWSNPLLEEECRKEALMKGALAHTNLKGTSLKESLEKIRRHVAAEEEKARAGTSYRDYLEHISKCRGFCGPHAEALLACHVSAVASLNHELVLFARGRHEVRITYAPVVERIASALRGDPNKRLVLIGRASRIGPRDYNRKLSARRVRAVVQELLASGVDEDRIQQLWFGYEPVHIEGWVAQEYGLRGLFDDVGELDMNQSVMLVLYDES